MGKRGEQRPPAASKGAASGGEGESGRPFPVHEHVGHRLKEMFDEVTTQPIPDKFVRLLAELEQKHSGKPQPDPAEPSPSKSAPAKARPRKSK
jgi:hypothetical protein